MINGDQIILFDGVCNLCSGMVKFVNHRDTKSKFRFVTLQSSEGKLLLQQSDFKNEDLNSIVYIQGSIYFYRSDAILQVLKDLGGTWKMFYAFKIIPKFIRDFFYYVISKSRYSVFGKRRTCMVPAFELKDRYPDL